MRSLLSLAALTLLGAPATAQLVVAGDTASGAYHIDLASGQSTRLWPNSTPINALAVDEPARRAWLVSVFVLRFWDYYAPFQGTVGAGPGIVTGLTFGNGVLYGVTNPGASVLVIDPALPNAPTALATLPADWRPGDLAWEPSSRRLLFPMPATATAAAGVYAFDPAAPATPSLFVSLPSGHENAVGLAVGSGRMWVLTLGLPIASYDLASGAWNLAAAPNPLPAFPVTDGAMDWSVRLPVRATYCTAKTSPSGCVPAMRVVEGHASASAGVTAPFSIAATGVVSQSPGLLVYGFAGPASLPFAGGTLCAAPPLHRTPAFFSGGTPKPALDCTGAWQIDLNAFAAGALGGMPRPELSVPGETVHCQWLGRDRSDPARAQLSDAMRYDVEP